MSALQTLDALLWSLAIALAAAALWLARPQPRQWEIRALLDGVLGERDLSDKPEAWQPAEWLGAGCGWPLLTDPPEPAVIAARDRRLAGLRLIWLEPPGLELPGLELPGLAARRVDPPEDGGAETLPEAAIGGEFEARMGEAMGGAQDRVVLAARSAAGSLLKLALAAPGLRDRLAAVLLIDPEIDPAWIERHFHHHLLDTELYRQVPWLILRHRQDHPPLSTPPAPQTGRLSIEVVDLGQRDPADPRLPAALSLLLAALAA